MHFNDKYFIALLILLVIEVTIAKFISHPFVRGFIGDVLVVILIFSLLKAFFKVETKKTAIGVLFFTFFIEFTQLFKLVELLSIKSELLKIVLGAVFDPWDFLAYSIGFFVLLTIEKLKISVSNYV